MNRPLDCSLDAQNDRRDFLRALKQKLYSGVESLGDRGRTVKYVSQSDLKEAIDGLEKEIAFCDGTLRVGTRIRYAPYSKWL